MAKQSSPQQASPQQAKRKAVKKKAKEEAIEKMAKEEAIEKMAEEEAIEKLGSSSIVNPGTKKRRASTHEPSDRAQKIRKRATSPHVDERAENVSPSLPRTPANISPSLHRTPDTQRLASHASLKERETIAYASDMEAQITAEARGVTRKNIPWDTFHSTYLCDFSIKAQLKLTVKSVKKIGQGNWEEKLFWDRLRQTFSDEVRCSGCAFIYLSVLC